jgi:hypothetical protein
MTRKVRPDRDDGDSAVDGPQRIEIE